MAKSSKLFSVGNRSSSCKKKRNFINKKFLSGMKSVNRNKAISDAIIKKLEFNKTDLSTKKNYLFKNAN